MAMLGSARLGCPPRAAPRIQPSDGERERRVEPAILPDPGAVTFSLAETEPIGTGQGQPEPAGHGKWVRATPVGPSTCCGKESWREPGAGKEQQSRIRRRRVLGHPWEPAS